MPMTDYVSYFRVLDCWECFQAQGRMCFDRFYRHMLYKTESANRGLGICCRPQANGDLCASDPDMICSHASYDPNSKLFRNILSEDSMNYQMFAFCPGVSREKCGFDNNDMTGFQLSADTQVSTISTTELRYVRGDQFTREYDACHYEITASSLISDA